jgi:hypothetical protein
MDCIKQTEQTGDGMLTQKPILIQIATVVSGRLTIRNENELNYPFSRKTSTAPTEELTRVWLACSS